MVFALFVYSLFLANIQIFPFGSQFCGPQSCEPIAALLNCRSVLYCSLSMLYPLFNKYALKRGGWGELRYSLRNTTCHILSVLRCFCVCFRRNALFVDLSRVKIVNWVQFLVTCKYAVQHNLRAQTSSQTFAVSIAEKKCFGVL